VVALLEKDALQAVSAKIGRLREKAVTAGASSDSIVRYVNVKDIFAPLVPGILAFLGGEPWTAFTERLVGLEEGSRHPCCVGLGLDLDLAHFTRISVCRSAWFVRYCQWKHLELNLKVRAIHDPQRVPWPLLLWALP
jgi:hypothetical protein